MRMKTIFAFIGFALCISTGQKILASDISYGASGSDSGSSSGVTQVAPPEFRQDACPATLVKWADDDFSDKQNLSTALIKFKSEAGACTSALKTYENSLKASGKKTSLSDAETMGTYLSNRYKQVAPTAANVLRNCNNLPDGKDKIVKTRYYMAMSKMEAVNSTLLDEISSIDGLLPKTVPDRSQTKNLDCSTIFPFPKVGQKCEDYKNMLNGSCKQSSEQRMKDMVEKTKTVLADVEELNGAYNQCKSAQGADAEACRAISTVIALKKSEVPWVDGNEFDKSYHDVRNLRNSNSQAAADVQARIQAMTNQKIQEGITRQLYYNRNKYVDEYKKNIKQAKCLTYTKADGSAPCDFEDTREYLSQLPDVTTPIEGTAQGREYDKYVEAENCLLDRGQDRAATASTVGGAARDALLTAATAGAAGAVKYGGLRIVKGMSTASKLKTASLVESGLAAANLGASFSDAAKQCAGKTKSLLKISEKPQEVAKDNVCPMSSSNIGLAEDDNSSCLISALLTSAGVYPFIKGLKLASQFEKFSQADLLKLYKDPKQRAAVEAILAKNGSIVDEGERMAASKALLGRELSTEEKACVTSAHNMSGDKVMKTASSLAAQAAGANIEILSQDDLKSKMNALSACGFSLTEASLLVRAGITGKVATSVEASNWASVESSYARAKAASAAKNGSTKEGYGSESLWASSAATMGKVDEAQTAYQKAYGILAKSKGISDSSTAADLAKLSDREASDLLEFASATGNTSMVEKAMARQLETFKNQAESAYAGMGKSVETIQGAREYAADMANNLKNALQKQSYSSNPITKKMAEAQLAALKKFGY